MMESLWSFIAGAAFFLAAELVLYRCRSIKMDEARKYLRLAKKEALETAQLSLNNPYPLIQISRNGSVVFINPAAFREFPGIVEQGENHPVLAGLDGAAAREVSFEGRVYHQTIAPAQANGCETLIIYCYDITERKAYEKKLEESRKITEAARIEAEKANQARGDFLANMSHELRTPMNAIIGLADILAEAGLNPEHHRLIEVMKGSAHALLVLLNDILDFSKIEAGELSIEAIDFDPRKIIQGIESLQKPVAARKGLEFKVRIDESVPQRLVGDPSRLRQILNNLIGNALKFTSEGWIGITLDGTQDGKENFIARIAVTDTGIGIPEDKQGQVFEKFQQADSSIARKYGGTGLGLAISQNLARLMGGNISLESREGEGTTFIVTVPVRIAESQDSRQEELDTPAPVKVNTAARILVVDDHPVNLLVLRQALTALGFGNCDEAESGAQALEMLKKEGRYDLILMDCQMPEMDGYEVTRRIREIEPADCASTVIAITANAMKGAEEKCRAAGMDDYISKPVDKIKLRETLHRWLPGGSDLKTDAGHGLKEERQPADGQAVFDWKHLRQFTDGKKDMEKMLVDMFLESLELDLKKLEKSLNQGNYDEWEATAHKIHGASSHMGACLLAAVCAKAEDLTLEDRGRINTLHQSIMDESRRLCGILQKSSVAA